MKEFAGKHFLLIVENNSVPFDKRVWREALALKDSGAEVSVIAPIYETDKDKFEIVERVNIFRYNLRFSSGSKIGYIYEYFIAFVKTIFLFNKLLKKGKFDVVHVANPPDIFWPLALYCKILRIKFIFDEHDLTPETLLSRFEISKEKAGIIYEILRLFQTLSYKYSDAIISTNESYRKRAVESISKNKDKVFVVRNGPDTRKFKSVPVNEDLKKGKKYLFAYIGIMAVQDGVDYIVNAANSLIKKKKFDDFIIYLIGSGSDTDRLKKMTADFKLEEYIKFTGRIPDEPALEILSTADICLSPDPFNPLNDSSTMNKVMEFMSLSKPIVSFDLTEAKFSAQDAAMYVKNNNVDAFAEGIMKLIIDKDCRIQMGRAGKKRVDEVLSWQKQIIYLINVYKYVLFKN